MARLSGVAGIRKSTVASYTWGVGTIDGNNYQLIKCFISVHRSYFVGRVVNARGSWPRILTHLLPARFPVRLWT